MQNNNNTNIINIITNLPSGTIFQIDMKFFNCQGVNLSIGTVISFGRYFKKNYAKYNCSFLGKFSNNHNNYRKN